MRWIGAVLLSLTVVVVGPAQPASALDWKDLTKIEKLDLYGPKVQQGKGIAKFALGLAPPGRAWRILSAAALAYGAYETADYLLNARQPGGDAADWLGESSAYPITLNDGMIVATVTSVSGRVITLDVNCSGWVPKFESPPGHWYYGCGASSNGETVGVATTNTVVHDVDCRNTTTGVHTTRLLSATWGRGAWTDNTANVSVASAPQCATGEVIDGFRLGASDPRHSSAWWRQTAPIGWGTMTGNTLPEGELTFEHAVIEAKCRNAETDEVQTIRTVSAWGDSETLVIPSCKQRLGPDWYGVGVKVIPMDPEIDDVPLDPEIWPDWDVPDFMPEEWDEEIVPEEEAQPCDRTAEGCPLVIEIDGEPVFPGSTTRTKIDTIRKLDPNRVKCYLGQREVEWKLCVPLLPSFEPGAGTGTTIDPTKPDTGTEIPTTGTGTQPVPTEAKTCMSGAWSWNPVDWVFVPVKCVLTWAFVPKTWPDWATITSPIPPGWVPELPSIAGGSCGVVNMPAGLNLGPLLPSASGGQLFDTCDYAAARNLTYYGTLALLLVVTGRRAFGAVMDAMGMQVKGDLF